MVQCLDFYHVQRDDAYRFVALLFPGVFQSRGVVIDHKWPEGGGGGVTWRWPPVSIKTEAKSTLLRVAWLEVEFRRVNGTARGWAGEELRGRRRSGTMAPWPNGVFEREKRESRGEVRKEEAGSTKCIRRFGLSGFHGVEFPRGPVCAHCRDSCIEGEWQGHRETSDGLASRGKYVEYLNKSKQPKWFSNLN